MTTLYCRADTEADAIDALEPLGLTGTVEGDRWWKGASPNLTDPIGRIMTDPGTIDSDGEELTAPAFAAGWHWNVYHASDDVVEALSGYVIDPTPTTPIRTLAGNG